MGSSSMRPRQLNDCIRRVMLYLEVSQSLNFLTVGRAHSHVGMERRLQDHYELGDIIGEGGFGSVCAGTCRQNGDSVSYIQCTLNVET